MTQYLISFGAHAMDHIPGQDAPAVAGAARAVVQEAISAGAGGSADGFGSRRGRCGGGPEIPFAGGSTS